jgi:UDP-glucose 4-epimerase
VLSTWLGTHELFDAAAQAVEVNVTGSLRVMQWCVRHNAQYTGILMPDVFPSIYTATKIAAKRLADALHHSGGLKVSHVRAFNAYGPGQKYGEGHPQKILPTFAVAAWRRLPLPIWGTGEQWVDLIRTDDLGRMLVDATGFVNNEVFDGGTGHSVSVQDVALFVNEYTGNQAGILNLPMRRGEDPTFIKATGEGWDLLGWRPEFAWSKLLETIDSYR